MLTVISGPPCSGKSTYLRNHTQPGDIVIDFDTLAQALGSGTPHDHNDHVRQVTRAARSAAITAAIREHHNGATVWIVDGRPPQRRIHTYQEAGATFVTLNADTDELHRRATAERPDLWHQLIDQWTPTTPQPSTAASRQW